MPGRAVFERRNGNGEYTQAELTPYLDNSGLSIEDRNELWEITVVAGRPRTSPKNKKSAPQTGVL